MSQQSRFRLVNRVVKKPPLSSLRTMPFSLLRMLARATVLVLVTLPVLGQISINEILAEGRDQDGRVLPDWIELYNAGNQPVNLAGYSLTDNPNTTRKWVFPANVTIPANGFRRIFLDSDRAASTVAEKDLNAGFALKSTGDQIELYSPSTLVENVRFGPQAVNYSIGKVPAGSASFVLCTPTPEAANVQQSLGPLRDLRINEWMASPSSGKDWFELYNPGALPVQLTGLYFTDDGNAPSPVAPLSYLGVDRYGFLRIYANNGTNDNEVNFKLSGSGDSISLFAVGGTPIDSVHFLQQTADISQGRLPDGSGNIKSLTAPTPGESNLIPYPNLVVNELLSHTDPPLEDAVEFYNQGDSQIDLSGWYLSNQRSDLKKFRVPNGTVVQPKGYVVFYEYQFGKLNDPSGFTFNSAHGDQVYLSQVTASGEFTGYVVSEQFESAENGVSFGHYETSVPGDYKFVAMEKLTFGSSATDTLEHFRTGLGAPNSKPKVGPVVINEIMYHPPSTAPDGSDNELDEFIELRNLSVQSVPLFDPLFQDNHWRLQNAIDYTFPRESLPPLAYALVVSFDPSDSAKLGAFRQKYGVLASVQIFGPYSGKLNNGGDPVELYRPDTPQQPPHPDAGYVPYLRVDKVNYSATAPWPPEADNTGNSLQRKNSSEFGNDRKNWQAAAPTAGKPNSGEVSDSDGDGLPDVWEDQYGFDKNNPADAPQDADNDGFTNLQEFLAGTNPRDPASKVSVAIVSVSDTAGTVLSFPSVPGKSYSVQYRNNLLPSTTWQKLMNVDAADNQTTVDDPTAGGKSARFYRLVTPAVN